LLVRQLTPLEISMADDVSSPAGQEVPVTVKLPTTLLQMVGQLAVAKRMTPHDIVREAITQYLTKLKKHN
jgi:hypothetical protein